VFAHSGCCAHENALCAKILQGRRQSKRRLEIISDSHDVGHGNQGRHKKRRPGQNKNGLLGVLLLFRLKILVAGETTCQGVVLLHLLRLPGAKNRLWRSCPPFKLLEEGSHVTVRPHIVVGF